MESDVGGSGYVMSLGREFTNVLKIETGNRHM